MTQIGVGEYHACGLKTDGAIVCWGANSNNQSTPPAGAFTQMSAGYCGGCAIAAGGIPTCWGCPAVAGQPFKQASQISLGLLLICGTQPDGTAACSGTGGGHYEASGPSPGTFTYVGAGNGMACGLKIDGTLACWGRTITAKAPRQPAVSCN